MTKIPTVVPFKALKNQAALYDFFMNLIEPDLVTTNLPVLDEAYDGETKEQHDERYAQYQIAFSVCEEVIQALFDETKNFSKNLAKKMDDIVNTEDADERSEALEKITQDIENQ